MDQTWSKLVVISTTVFLFIYFILYYFIFIILLGLFLFCFFLFLGGGGGGYIKLMFNYVSFINSVHTRISNLHQGLTPA